MLSIESLTHFKSPHIHVATHFAELKASHPEWMMKYDETEFGFASFDDLTHLLSTAPSAFAAGLMYGKMAIMRSISTLTERPFEPADHITPITDGCHIQPSLIAA